MELAVVGLGLGAAVAYGATDFFGGMASRRADSALPVVVLFKIVALVLFAGALVLADEPVTSGALVWGGAAGAAMGLGYLAYFRGLARGHMGVVATITAVWSAVVPVGVGVGLGERPGRLVWAGIATIIGSITLITSMGDARTGRPGREERFGGRAATTGMAAATAAGIGFGLFFVGLAQADDGSPGPAWPLLAAATAAVVVVGAPAVVREVDWSVATAQWPMIVAAGVGHAAGTWAFLAGAARGWVSVVAVLVALSPAATMLLARLVLAETLAARQYLGIGLALAGVGLITTGSVS